MEGEASLSRTGLAPPRVGAVPQLLQEPRAWELRARFCGDPLLDAAVEAETIPGAARVLFGDRATKQLSRAVAEALLGPPAGRYPGREAAWWSISIAIAVDGTLPEERLGAQELAMVVGAGADGEAPVRRSPMPAIARDRVKALLVGTPARLRRNIGIELVLDPSDRPERMHRLLVRSRIAPEQITPAYVRDADDLYQAAVLLAGPLASKPLLVTRTAAGFVGRPVAHVDELEVRVMRSRGQAAFEGWRMQNCLAGHAPRAMERGSTLVTVWRRDGSPLASVELDPAGEIETIRGPSNRWVDGARTHAILQALASSGLLPARDSEIRGPADEVAARVSCRAAALLSAELDPDRRLLGWADDYTAGDRALELLGDRSEWLTERQLRRLRGQHDTGPSRTGTPDDADEWIRIAAMLSLSGVGVEALDPPWTSNAQQAARWHARLLLHRQLRLPDVAPRSDSRVLVNEPSLPLSAREGVSEVLGVWRRWGRQLRR